MLLDLYARRVVGWSMSDRPDLSLVLGALDMALGRRPARGLIHHTDQGVIYSARVYRETMHKHGLVTSKGSAYDNAVAESFFSNLKNELVHHRDFTTRAHARAAIFDYIEVFYNRAQRPSDARIPHARRSREAMAVCLINVSEKPGAAQPDPA